MPNEIESYTPFYKGKPLYGLGGGGGGSSTDENVLQTPTDSVNSDYEVLLSSTADNVERTEGARKTQHIKFNPFTKLLKLTGHLYDKWGLQTSRTMFEEDFEQLTQAEKDNGTNYYIPDGVPLRICDYIYPIGAIYMSVTNVSPAILFGGTWERIEDKFLLAAGQTYNVGSSGGEAEHILTTDEIPAHTHGNKSLTGTMNPLAWAGSASESGIVSGRQNHTDRVGNSGSNWGDRIYTINASHEHNSVGLGYAHNNMPPYLVVNVWMRVPDPVEQEEEEGE